jgi:hypothetical protein
VLCRRDKKASVGLVRVSILSLRHKQFRDLSQIFKCQGHLLSDANATSAKFAQ